MASERAVDSNVDFTAWLKAQGVNAEVARAMDSELGIRDYGVLRACVGDGHVRAELLAAARDRLPFGFYAVLRQVVRSLHLAEAERPRGDAAALRHVAPDGLLDVLVVLFSGLSRELLRSAHRLGKVDGGREAVRSRGAATATEDDCNELLSHVNGGEFGNFEPPTSAEAFESHDWIHPAPCEDDGLTASMDCTTTTHLWNRIKLEQSEAISYESFRVMGVEKPFACDECGKSFADLTSLKKHQMIHTGLWPHVCHDCGKGFSKVSHLTRHQRTHTGERPYVCDLCGKGFSQVPNLKRHRRTHDGAWPLACDDCGREFSSVPQLEAHRRAKHGKAAAVSCGDGGHRS